MRFLLGLLLVLMMVPTGAWSAPCCEEAGGPSDRDCAAEEGTCPATAHPVAVTTVPILAAAPVAATFAIRLEPARPAVAPPFHGVRATRSLPLRN